MDAAWQKLAQLWKSHKTRFVGAIFGLVLVFGIGTSIAIVHAAQPVSKTGTTPAAPAAAPAATPAAPAATAPQKTTITGDSTSESFYDKGLNFLAYVAEAIAQLATTILISLISILISIISYDAFSHSTVIDVGWPIVRDAINMFVVLALLAIAIMNLIPGRSDNARTQQQLLNVLVAVVLMNFSRTIVLMAVDFSQVVTLTFAQAVSDIAAGNFIQLFSIQNNLVVNATVAGVSSGAGQGGLLVGTAMFKVLLIGTAIITMISIIAAFLVRILLIWFLVILAPAAFFAWGIKGVFPQASQIYSKWMDQFTGLLLFGPVLMFFLWLSLAISTGGDIAGSEGFGAMPDVTVTTLVSSAEPASLLSTIVGILMLMIGIVAAGQVAGSTAGVSDILKKGESTAKSFALKGAKTAAWGTAMGATGGFAAGALAGSTGLAAGALQLGAGIAGAAAPGAVTSNKAVGYYQSGARGLVKFGGYAERTLGVVPVVGAPIGRAIQTLGGMGAKATGDLLDARRREAKENLEKMDSSQRDEILKMQSYGTIAGQIVDGTANRTPPWLRDRLKAVNSIVGKQLTGREIGDLQEETRAKLVTDKGEQKRVRDSLGKDQANAILRSSMEEASQDGYWDYLPDDASKKKAKEELLKTKARNMHLLSETEKRKVVEDADFKTAMLSKDSLSDATTRSLLAGTVARSRRARNPATGEMETISDSHLDMVTTGGAGQELRDFADQGYVELDRVVNANGGVIMTNVQDPEQVRIAIERSKAKMGQLTQDIYGQFTDNILNGITNVVDTLELQDVPDAALRRRMRTDLGAREADLATRFADRQAYDTAAATAAATGAPAPGGPRPPFSADDERNLTNTRKAIYKLEETGDTYLNGVGNARSDQHRDQFQDVVDRNFIEARRVDVGRITAGSHAADDLVTAFASKLPDIERTVRQALAAGDRRQQQSIAQALERYQAAIEHSINRQGRPITAAERDQLRGQAGNLHSLLA